MLEDVRSHLMVPRFFFFLNCITQQKSTFLCLVSPPAPPAPRVGGQREQSKNDPATIDPVLPACVLTVFKVDLLPWF